MVIAYAMHPLSWWLTRRKKLQPWVGLPNILARQFLVPEFLQDQAQPQALAQALHHWLSHPDEVQSLQDEFLAMHHTLQRNTATSSADAIQKILDR
jgi:lipid-A-disaccharide synthase